jgi:hypothetical protein
MKNPIYFVASNRADPTMPHRNYLCPEYDLCLTQAAVEDLALDCRACEMRNQRADITLYSWEIVGYDNLLRAVFGRR